MRRILQNGSRVRSHIPQVALSKGLACGAVGGLAATMVMDLVLMVVFSALGLPALTCFTIVGNTAARMFSLQALQTSGSAPLGAAVHYLVGPLIGAIFGALVSQNQALRVRTLQERHPARRSVCRDPEPADPCHHPHPVELHHPGDHPMVRRSLRDAFHLGRRSGRHREHRPAK